MAWEAYRRVLARPGAGRVLAVGALVRVATTSIWIVLTLRVVLPGRSGGLGLGYTEAGLVAGLVAVGTAIGSPFVGRGVDRFGARAVLLTTAGFQAVFWTVAIVLPFAALAPCAFAAGLVCLPIVPVGRQALAALVPAAERQAAFAMDMMSFDVAYALGPLLGVTVATQAGCRVALGLVAVLLAAGGAVLGAVVGPALPPARFRTAALDGIETPAGPEAADEVTDGPGGVTVGSRRRATGWLRARPVAMLLVGAGSTATLAGTDVTMTASMRSFGVLPLLGVVAFLWTVGSITGGLVYGALQRPVPPVLLLAGLAVLTVPVAFAPSWGWLAVLLVVAGLFCAPVLSAAADRLIQVTPQDVRGTVLGAHASALSVGNFLGADVAGLVIDRAGPARGYLAVSIVGAALAVAAVATDPPALLTGRRGGPRAGLPVQPQPAELDLPVNRA
ncbi:MFS transporter [Pseudofrankia sp. DC12]|uniref:MFS transporter n=1 Tax=Pseudofrankia sp. DC12 TaxID=683315 RepID=UPI000696CCBF|nr:MFS transporter [Pseudofrankia sp. DC12]